MARARKKTWKQKVEIVKASFTRATRDESFPRTFYKNLFFLNPAIEKYFAHTDFIHQDKAIMHGMKFLMDFLDQNDANARAQILRIANSHSSKNMNIHPHDYYYWIEAAIMTAKEYDSEWYDDLEYYWREVIHFPISFIISLYFKSE